MIYNFIKNNDINKIIFSNNNFINFLFKNNKFGDIINKINIRIIGTLVRYYRKKQELPVYQKILFNCIKLLDLAILPDDTYMKNLNHSAQSIDYSPNMPLS